MPYPQQVTALVELLRRPPLRDARPTVALDATGCGAPVRDMFKAARPAGCTFVPITIHGGDKVSYHDGYRVPKRDLVGVVQVLLQERRLTIAEVLDLAPVLRDELLAFKVKIDPETAHDSYSAWRERDHDDCVLAVACAAWSAERNAGRVTFGPNIWDPPGQAGIGD